MGSRFFFRLFYVIVCNIQQKLREVKIEVIISNNNLRIRVISREGLQAEGRLGWGFSYAYFGGGACSLTSWAAGCKFEHSFTSFCFVLG